MAEVAVDERRLLKTLRWYDGFVIGLANPGFLLIGLAFSIGALGGTVAAILWTISGLIGSLQAYVYAEPAAMFPDKPGGLSVYAREGWRKYFSLAGPIAVFGYWFAWSSVLAVYGGFIGLLIFTEFFPGSDPFEVIASLGFLPDITWPRLIGLAAIIACYVFNIRGMRPAMWFSYAVGALMLLPVIAIAIGPFLSGDFGNNPITSAGIMEGTLDFYGFSTGTWGKFILIMTWLYVIGWSSYGPESAATFAPEFKDTKNDTRKALAANGILNAVLALLLPLTVVATIGYDAIVGDLTGVVYLVEVMHLIVGNAVGTLLTLCLCAGLLLSMNTATMDGSRALYALAEEGMTIKQLAVLNHHNVPARAMTVDMVLNVVLLFVFPSIFFILAAGNLGYMLSHVLALSGVLLLRKDRPTWPRPIKLAPIWMALAAAFAVANLAFIVFGLIGLPMTGYAWDFAFTDPRAFTSRIIVVGALALVAGVVGYVIALRQHGKPFKMSDPSNEQPSQEAIETAAAVAR